LPFIENLLALSGAKDSHTTWTSFRGAGQLDEVGRQIGQHIAIDGKTLRGSFDAAAGRSPLHLVSAWASEARLT
jgi:hypothetical protein